jgi:hypothetical protein
MFTLMLALNLSLTATPTHSNNATVNPFVTGPVLQILLFSPALIWMPSYATSSWTVQEQHEFLIRNQEPRRWPLSIWHRAELPQILRSTVGCVLNRPKWPFSGFSRPQSLYATLSTAILSLVFKIQCRRLIFRSPAGSLYNHVASIVIRRRPSFVCMAHFVTAGAIDPKLCIYVPLRNSQTKFRCSLILGLATRGPKPKTQKVLYLWKARVHTTWTNNI